MLAPISILDLAMHPTVLFLDKTLYAYFTMGPSSLPIVVAQRDEKPANKTKKSALHWCD